MALFRKFGTILLIKSHQKSDLLEICTMIAFPRARTEWKYQQTVSQ